MLSGRESVGLRRPSATRTTGPACLETWRREIESTYIFEEPADRQERHRVASSVGCRGGYSGDPLHQTATLSPTNLLRIRASKPGGTWRDWDPELVATCHRKRSGKTYPSVYGRMSWDEPAPTVTTQFFGFGNGRFGHPEQDRAISLREGAILQSFPKNYRFVKPGEPIHFSILGRLIGNAVPVKLGEAIGRSLVAHVLAFDKNLADELSSEGSGR